MVSGYKWTRPVRVNLAPFESRSTILQEVIDRDPRPWLRLSVAAALLAAAGNAATLFDVERFYGAESTSMVDQATAQDLVNLCLVAPATLLLAWRGLRNSLASYLTWLGFVTFTVYSYAIYTLSIQFGWLFPLWVAVLGMSLFALLGGANALVPNGLANAQSYPKRNGAGGFLIVVAALFALLWSVDIVRALLDGSRPNAARDAGLPTSPVHVLDLAFFLPAAMLVGWSLLQRRPLGYAAAPAMLTFLGLIGLPVIVTVFVADHRGHDAAWPLLVPFGAITAASAVLTWTMVRNLRLRR